MDYQGIAILIGAVSSSVIGIGSLMLQYRVLLRQTKASEKLEQVHELVNGQSELLRSAAFAAGEKSEKDKHAA